MSCLSFGGSFFFVGGLYNEQETTCSSTGCGHSEMEEYYDDGYSWPNWNKVHEMTEKRAFHSMQVNKNYTYFKVLKY